MIEMNLGKIWSVGRAWVFRKLAVVCAAVYARRAAVNRQSNSWFSIRIFHLSQLNNSALDQLPLIVMTDALSNFCDQDFKGDNHSMKEEGGFEMAVDYLKILRGKKDMSCSMIESS